MNRTIKNIFAVTALTLTFAPALRCEDAQTVKTSKLQSVINYVKNIRKSLTPQEKLAQYITSADVTGFKNAYNSFQKWPATERATTLQALTVTIQEVKQALQTELESNGNKANKTTLAKGVAQTVVGAISLTTMACMSKALYKTMELLDILGDGDAYDDWYDNSLSIKILYTKPFAYILDPYIFGRNTIFAEDARISLISSDVAFIIAGAILGAYTAKTGLQNCKNGWNYKAYLQQQIANIDEISAFIQEQLKSN